MSKTLRWAILALTLPGARGIYAQAFPHSTAPNAESSQAAPSRDGTTPADALINKAENAIVHEQYDHALPLLNDVIAKAPANSTAAARAFYDRGYVEQEQHQISAAEADYRKATETDPKQFESAAALGRLLVQQEHWKQARKALEAAALLQPATGDPRLELAAVARLLARVDAQLHDPAAASDALIAALKYTPEELDDTLLAARLAEEEGTYSGAEGEFRKALNANPKSLEAAEGLTRVLIHERKFSDAEAVAQQALPQEPNDPTLLALSATALAGEGKNQAAVEQLEQLHRQNPDQPSVTRMLADLYSNNGNAQEAAGLYDQLISADAKNPDLLTAAGENLIREQKWQEAVRTLQKSVDIQPAQEDAWSGLAFAAFENHDYPLVISALDSRAKFLPDGPATLFLRANALDHLHQSSAAAKYYRMFLAQAHGSFSDEVAEARNRLAALPGPH